MRWRDHKKDPGFAFQPWMRTVDELEDQIEELAGALRRMTECAECYYRQINPDWSGEYFEDSDFGRARAALAKLEQDQ
jgi:hypothetical protein